MDTENSMHLPSTSNYPPKSVELSKVDTAWHATLNYDQTPTTLFSSLPVPIQHMIATRVRSSSYPLFVLVTSEEGHWHLVQLEDGQSHSESVSSSAVSDIQDKSLPHSITTHQKESSSSSTPMNVPYFEILLNSTSVVQFSGSSVTFQFKSHHPELHWHCPFCDDAPQLDNHMDKLAASKAHLRVHIELRCCMTCVTVLPNASTSSSHCCLDYMGRRTRRACRLPLPVITNTYSIADDPPVSSNPTKNSELPGSEDRIPVQSSELKPDKTAGARKTWTCPCCKTFNTSVKFQQHMKNVHRNPRFRCSDCNASFSTKGNLTKHLESVHSKNSLVRCSQCNKCFKNKFNLNRHIRSAHPPTDLGDMKPNQASETSSSTLKTSSNPNTTIAQQTKSHRGFYLYVSNPVDKIQTEAIHEDTPTMERDSVDFASSAQFLADVQLTPCSTSNPKAQYGTGSNAWRSAVVQLNTSTSRVPTG